VVSNNTLFIGQGNNADGYEYALDAETGALKWRTAIGTTADAGVVATAAVQNGIVYVAGGDYYFYALDAQTGEILWKVPTGDNPEIYYNFSSPLLYNGYAYYGTDSWDDPIPQAPGRLLQIDLTTHSVRTFSVVPAGQVGGAIWSSPTVDPATGTIYVTTGNEGQEPPSTQPYALAIVALDATTLDAKGSWQIPSSYAGTDSDWGTTPVLFTDSLGRQLVAATNKNGYTYAFDRADLEAGPVWQQQVAKGGSGPEYGDGSVSSGASGDGILFIAGGNTEIGGAGYAGSVRALDPATGRYIWEHGAPGVVRPALAYANGLVFDAADSTMEVLDATSGARLYSFTAGGEIWGQPIVANGRVYVGSTDGNVYALGLQSATTTPPGVGCPSEWNCQSVGTTSPGSIVSAVGTEWSATGGVGGIGGTADGFDYIYQSVISDTQLSVQVVSTTSDITQAGLMMRQSLDPASPYYAVTFTQENGLAIQYRYALGGISTTQVQVETDLPPRYIEIRRIGDWFIAESSSDGVSYAIIPGSQVYLPMPVAALAGVATATNASESSGIAVYDAANIGSPASAPLYPPCPVGWNCGDIGDPPVAGTQVYDGTAWTVQSIGQNMYWSDWSQARFMWRPVTGDSSFSVRVVDQSAESNPGATGMITGPWSKAGIMLRQGLDPQSPFYLAALTTSGQGVHVQYRSALGTPALEPAVYYSPLPTYLQVERQGDTFTTFTSADGVQWSPVAGSSVTVTMSGTVLGGWAVTSGVASFDSISTTAPAVMTPTATATIVPPATALPSGTATPDSTAVVAVDTPTPVVATSRATLPTEIPAGKTASTKASPATTTATVVAAPTVAIRTLPVPLAVGFAPRRMRPGDMLHVHVHYVEGARMRVILSVGNRTSAIGGTTDRDGQLVVSLRVPMSFLRKGSANGLLRVSAERGSLHATVDLHPLVSNLIMTITAPRRGNCKVLATVHVDYIARAVVQLYLKRSNGRQHLATLYTGRDGTAPDYALAIPVGPGGKLQAISSVEADGRRGTLHHTQVTEVRVSALTSGACR
jgi:outer membrane protein assembly factor BamB